MNCPLDYDRIINNSKHGLEIEPSDEPEDEVMLAGTVHAATDVTGYGLLGHLRTMLRESGVAAEIHDRMPVIVPRELRSTWMDTAHGRPQELQHVLEQEVASALEAFPVSSFVGSPKNDSPECIAPLSGLALDEALR